MLHLPYVIKHQGHYVSPRDLVLDRQLEGELDPLAEDQAAAHGLAADSVFHD